MVKIKRKVEMTLSELIEWGFKQKELLPLFYGSKEESFVQFTPNGCVNITGIKSTDTFTVEVEKEITEDTKLPKCLEISFDRKSGRDIAVVYENCSVKQLTDRNPEHLLDIRTIHLVNDDGTVKLIWKNGELVGDE